MPAYVRPCRQQIDCSTAAILLAGMCVSVCAGVQPVGDDVFFDADDRMASGGISPRGSQSLTSTQLEGARSLALPGACLCSLPCTAAGTSHLLLLTTKCPARCVLSLACGLQAWPLQGSSSSHEWPKTFLSSLSSCARRAARSMRGWTLPWM